MSNSRTSRRNLSCCRVRKTKDSGDKDITDVKPGMAVNLTPLAAITNRERHKMVQNSLPYKL